MVMVVVVAVGALNVQFKPKRVSYEVYGLAPTIGRPELCGASQSRREVPATGLLLSGWRKVFR
jgi:hypothetical protein